MVVIINFTTYRLYKKLGGVKCTGLGKEPISGRYANLLKINRKKKTNIMFIQFLFTQIFYKCTKVFLNLIGEVGDRKMDARLADSRPHAGKSMLVKNARQSSILQPRPIKRIGDQKTHIQIYKSMHKFIWRHV